MKEKFSISDNYHQERFNEAVTEAIIDRQNIVSELKPEQSKQVETNNIVIEGEMPDEKKELAEDITYLLGNLSQDISKKVIDVLNGFCKEKSRPTEKILKYVEANNLDLPVFILIGDPEKIKKKLAELGYQEAQISPQNILVIFNLPKQAARHWRKGGSKEWGEQEGIEDDFYIEWGRVYRRIIPVVWRFLDDAYEFGKIGFDRVNAPGEHSPKNFYYIWEAWKRKFYRDQDTEYLYVSK